MAHTNVSLHKSAFRKDARFLIDAGCVVGGISIKSVRIKLGRCPSKPLHPDLHPKGAQVGSQHTSLSNHERTHANFHAFLERPETKPIPDFAALRPGYAPVKRSGPALDVAIQDLPLLLLLVALATYLS